MLVRIGIGLLFVIGGLSGDFVLRGTNLSWPLVVIGLGMIAAGFYGRRAM